MKKTLQVHERTAGRAAINVPHQAPPYNRDAGATGRKRQPARTGRSLGAAGQIGRGPFAGSSLRAAAGTGPAEPMADSPPRRGVGPDQSPPARRPPAPHLPARPTAPAQQRRPPPPGRGAALPGNGAPGAAGGAEAAGPGGGGGRGEARGRGL